MFQIFKQHITIQEKKMFFSKLLKHTLNTTTAVETVVNFSVALLIAK